MKWVWLPLHTMYTVSQYNHIENSTHTCSVSPGLYLKTLKWVWLPILTMLYTVSQCSHVENSTRLMCQSPAKPHFMKWVTSHTLYMQSTVYRYNIITCRIQCDGLWIDSAGIGLTVCPYILLTLRDRETRQCDREQWSSHGHLAVTPHCPQLKGHLALICRVGPWKGTRCLGLGKLVHEKRRNRLL